MYTYNQLSKQAKSHCLEMQRKYNFKNLDDGQIIKRVKDWHFFKDGTLHTGFKMSSP